MQIAHAGGRANIQSNAVLPEGPSSLEMAGYICKEMTVSEIMQTIEDFVRAAIRAEKAGFDGIQLHGAHATLLSQFLSPFFNKRKDHYGGSLENRARILLEILQAIRLELGRQFAVTIKLNSDDFIDGGFTPEEMAKVSARLDEEGIDAIEISGGSSLSVSKYSSSRSMERDSREEEVYYRDAARLYKESLTVPLILVGDIRTYETAKKLIEKEETDYISLCRPLIREPDLIKRWQSGDTSRAGCISCNKCFIPTRAGEGLYCVLDK